MDGLKEIIILQYVWRFRQPSMLDYGYPTLIRNLFRELPSNLRNIDALYERPNGNIVFFSGTEILLKLLLECGKGGGVPEEAELPRDRDKFRVNLKTR